MSLAAAARELAEETDVHVPTDSLRPIGVWDTPDRGPRGRYITVAYMVVVPVGTAIIAGDDVRTGRWWPLDRLPERLAFDHAAILNGGGWHQCPEHSSHPRQRRARSLRAGRGA